MRIAYADPPYPGCAHRYEENTEVDHAELLTHLETFDGWILHTHEPGLRVVVPLLPKGARVMSWVKPWCAFKRNVSVAHAWEPVIVKACRKPVVSGRIIMRDWISESMTMKKGLTGAKPPAVCRWAFEMVGAEPGDDLADLYPGTGIVTETWDAWRQQYSSERSQLELTGEHFDGGECDG